MNDRWSEPETGEPRPGLPKTRTKVAIDVLVLSAELAYYAGYSHCLLLGNLLMWPSGTLMMPIIKCHVGKISHLDSLTPVEWIFFFFFFFFP
ncbi:hypothetical protein COLO4_32029 [Corchorus olitorius]|uniref:Uncharacterized protein n=1 Tax=Corchorus olitorius TaxID=93759 RepID=A0A1R3H2D4_9ROSI|nr:hypothetical protein COLO4_32029 [Corchorus olitorius]